MNKSTNFITFILGVFIGSIVTRQYVEKKYEKIAQEEIDSVKEIFYKRSGIHNEKTEKNVSDKEEKTNVVQYETLLNKHNYTAYSKKEEDKKSMNNDRPYIIIPEEFSDDFEDYEKITLTYYADHFLADDNDQLIENIDDIVGFESLNCFKKYEDDSVFVRNDRLKCDYEILLDQRTYSNVIGRKPHEVDD